MAMTYGNMKHELEELTAEICETVDWPEWHRVGLTQNEQVRAILERFMKKHYQYEDALVAAIPKMMQQAEKSKETDPNVIRAHEKAQKFIKEHPNVPVVDVPKVDDGPDFSDMNEPTME